MESVDGILKRLGTEYLDILLLHRPDPLVEPEEVAEAFSKLKESGKVRHFGVSNMNRPALCLMDRVRAFFIGRIHIFPVANPLRILQVPWRLFPSFGK